jgi:site-specific recombinase XerD
MRPAYTELGSPLAEPIRRFIAHKRALNRRFDCEEKALHLFDRYLVERGMADVASVTPGVVEDFLASRPRRRPRSYNHLLGVARRLFDWMVDQELLVVSPLRLRPRRETARRIPYIFDLPQACRLLEIAAALPDNSRALQRGMLYATIFAILYGLGLRVGEVARLTRSDVDLSRRLLIIRETKFGKSRLVPFGPRMAARLTTYISLKERQGGALSAEMPAFSFTAGESIHPGTISQTFHALVPRLGLTLPAGVALPRVHDLRHSFAVGTLLRWYREGLDPAAKLLHLSTFLGHVNPASTATYLTITADLLQSAGERFGRFAAPLSTGGRP